MGFKKELLLQMRFLLKIYNNITTNIYGTSIIKRNYMIYDFEIILLENQIRVHLPTPKYLENKDSNTIFNNF